MGEYLRYVALPDVSLRFVESKLTGEAKAQYEGLAKTQKRNFHTLVNGKKEMCREETCNKKIIALGELKRLQKPETLSVGDFCVELERLTRRAYPQLEDRTLSVIHADYLYDQLSHWDESCYLQEALEGPGSVMYERLKDAAMRVERKNLAFENCARSKPPSSP
ncbi:hypothetical protein V3C99_005285 [Haemonchus contortus]|uniref:Transposase n=1 Tax=Haemonchus contortus TaxID=6289 RepID=A0A7I4XUT7_HAECO